MVLESPTPISSGEAVQGTGALELFTVCDSFLK